MSHKVSPKKTAEQARVEEHLKREAEAHGDVLMAAIRVLIGFARLSETKVRRLDVAEWHSTIELDSGEVEHWKIAVSKVKVPRDNTSH